MLIFIGLFFSIEGKSNLNALPVGCFLSTSIFCFYHSVGREDLLVSAGKENMTCGMLSFYFCYYLALKWEVKFDVAFSGQIY